MEKVLEKMKERLEGVGEGDFGRQVEAIYMTVEKKAAKNKDNYFKIQSGMLYCSMGVNIINVLVAFLASFDHVITTYIAQISTSIASILSIVLTAMIAKKENRKYSETWLRHQSHQADMQFAIMEYVYKNGTNSPDEERRAADGFIDSMFEIWKKNQEKFNSNMKYFDKK